jgi:hypothetical protein
MLAMQERWVRLDPGPWDRSHLSNVFSIDDVHSKGEVVTRGGLDPGQGGEWWGCRGRGVVAMEFLFAHHSGWWNGM